jgi:FAD/FMN-containing dehydrogenase
MATPAAAPAPLQLSALQGDLGGQVLTPASPGYDAARHNWQGLYDRRPAVIAQCDGVADVIAALRFAREYGLEVAVRGACHSVHGHSSSDGGIVIDMRRMKGIRVDPQARMAQAQAGLTWGEFDRETQAFGLATTGGRVSTTGIAGLTLGSGSGWLERSFGLSCDNLISADVVTADGELVTASEGENADLLWGLRGGGGNFGVVTSFQYRLHPVGPVVLGGMLLYRGERAAELLPLYRDHVEEAPDEFGGAFGFLTGPPEPFIPPELRGQRLAAIIVCHIGDRERGEELLRPFRERGPDVDLVQPMPYVAVQQLLDESAAFGLHSYWKTEAVDELTDAAVDTLVEHVARQPLGHTITVLEPGRRGIAQVGEHDTPISRRDAHYRYYAVAAWEPDEEPAMPIAWARELATAMEPFSRPGVQLNFVSDLSDERVRATFGQRKYERLAALKAQYDPDNVFHLNANIKPYS